jgi:hypothetical protein
MTNPQCTIYDTILHAVQHSSPHSTTPRLFFVTGKAGRGKSFIIHVLIAFLCSQSMIAAVAGSTALSISDVDHARTAHNLFGLPVVDDDNNGVTSRIPPHSPRAEYLRIATIIIWDELLMAHVNNIHATDSLLHELMDSTHPFGGKIVVGLGDFHQVAPIVKNGGPTQTFMASILSSSLWKKFHTLQLSDPIRNALDPHFSEFIDAIGEDDDKSILIPRGLVVTWQCGYPILTPEHTWGEYLYMVVFWLVYSGVNDPRVLWCPYHR